VAWATDSAAGCVVAAEGSWLFSPVEEAGSHPVMRKKAHSIKVFKHVNRLLLHEKIIIPTPSLIMMNSLPKMSFNRISMHFQNA